MTKDNFEKVRNMPADMLIDGYVRLVAAELAKREQVKPPPRKIRETFQEAAFRAMQKARRR